MSPTGATAIFKIVPAAVWAAAERNGAFAGAGIDLKDGYIHFSSAEQVAETARLHFAGQEELVLVAVDPAAFGATLKWEPSRGGALFPHLYGALDPKRILWVKPIPLGADGRHLLPDLTR
jgi:uncharacterized protein (DUF952 family)